MLAHNEILYPFHKWFVRVLERAPHQPPALIQQIQTLALAPDRAAIDQFAASIRAFRPWPATPATWPAQFLADSENNWLRHPPPVDDL